MQYKNTIPLLLVASALYSGICSAQPDWLRQVARDAASYPVHKDASVLLLHSTNEVTIAGPTRVTSRIRTAVKILKSAGEKSSALTEMLAPFRRVTNLKGWVITAEGAVHTLSKEHIVEVSVSEGRAYYDDSRMLVASMPQVEPHAITAFEYTIEENDWTGLYQRFVFQRQQPAKFVQLSVVLPPGAQLHKSEWNLQGLAYEVGAQRHTWTATDLPYQPEEPAMPSWSYLAKELEFTCTFPASGENAPHNSWQSVAAWCARTHATAALPDSTVQAEVQRLTQGKESLFDKLHAIAAFVRDEIRYVAVEIGKERWEPRPAAVTLRNRYGDCKDKTVLMRAMLAALGVSAYSALASTNHYIDPNLPTPYQFNHCIIAIARAQFERVDAFSNAGDGPWLFFDPTDVSTRLGDLPTVLQGDLVLIAAPGDTLLHRLPERPPASNRRRYEVQAKLQPDGSISAEICVKDFGNFATAVRYQRRITPVEKQIEAWRTELAQRLSSASLHGFQQGAEGDSAWVKFRLSATAYAISMNSFWTLKPDFVTTLELPAFTAKQRQHPIWLGSAVQLESQIAWQLPEGWAIEEVPPSVESVCPTAKLACQTQGTFNVPVMHSKLERFGRMLPVSKYAEAKQFSQALAQVNGMTWVLKKN